jgi:hypothetical protein
MILTVSTLFLSISLVDLEDFKAIDPKSIDCQATGNPKGFDFKSEDDLKRASDQEKKRNEDFKKLLAHNQNREPETFSSVNPLKDGVETLENEEIIEKKCIKSVEAYTKYNDPQ